MFCLASKATRRSFRDPFLPGKLARALPAGVYRFANAPHDTALAVLGWALTAYRFDRYKKKKDDQPQLVPPDEIDLARIEALAAGVTLGRDLINTPANDHGPRRARNGGRDTRHAIRRRSWRSRSATICSRRIFR